MKKIKKNVEKINKAIKKNNVAFDKATPNQQRVMIAQDVLDQIKAKRYVAESGTWVDAYYNDDDIKKTDSVQKLFAEHKIESCRVCALGGLFMSCTNLNNNVSVKTLENITGVTDCQNLGQRISNNKKLPNGLNRIFSKEQLILIETYFEANSGWFIDRSTSDTTSPDDFYDAYPDAYDRLVEIMENIIKNDGTFIPSKSEI